MPSTSTAPWSSRSSTEEPDFETSLPQAPEADSGRKKKGGQGPPGGKHAGMQGLHAGCGNRFRGLNLDMKGEAGRDFAAVSMVLRWGPPGGGGLIPPKPCSPRFFPCMTPGEPWERAHFLGTGALVSLPLLPSPLSPPAASLGPGSEEGSGNQKGGGQGGRKAV